MKLFAVAAAALASLTIAAPAHAGGEHFAAGALAGGLCRMHVKGASVDDVMPRVVQIIAERGINPRILLRSDVQEMAAYRAYQFCGYSS